MRSRLSPQLEPRSLAQTQTCARASKEDLREYLVHLDQTNLSEAQKFELLQTLWSIMSTFVDLAFGADPVQTVLPPIRSDVDSEDSIPAGRNQPTEG